MAAEGFERGTDGLQEMVMASLFYEIGRFRRRTTGDSRPYPEVGQEWLKTMGLEGILRASEEHRELIAEAAALAAGGELPEEPEGDQALQPLVCSFSQISLPKMASAEPPVDQAQRPEAPSLKEQVPPPCEEKYYPLQELRHGPDACPYPQKEVAITRDDYQRLWEAFGKDLRAFGGLPSISCVLLVLEKYASFVPHLPSGPEGPRCDLSLFDQARATAAIASCLYQRIAEEEEGDFSEVGKRSRSKLRYLLVGGDFSGTQKFIYRISSKGALKTLRARSFFLELFTEHVIWELLEPLGLSRANVLYAGGARFTLLLPNTPRAQERIREVRRQVNLYFAEHHGARIYLVLEAEELDGGDLATPLPAEAKEAKKRFWGKLEEKVTSRKWKKFVEFLEKGESKEFTSLLFPPESSGEKPRIESLGRGKCSWCQPKEADSQTEADLFRAECGGELAFGCERCLKELIELSRNDLHLKVGECQICHRITWLIPLPPPAEEVRACSFCRALYHLGEHLHALRYILRTKKIPSEKVPSEMQRVFLQVGDTYYLFPLVPKGVTPEAFDPQHFSEFEKKVFEDPKSMAWIVNEEQPASYREKANLHPLLLANYHQPRDRDAIRRGLQELAEKAVGACRIGVLRMDVDSLGNLFKSALQKEGGLLRYTALSRLLSRFLKLYLNGFCEGKGLPNGQRHLLDKHLLDKDPASRQAAIVYSGGDDLFLVGAWSDVAELAFDLRTAFKAYTCHNQAINISGGMIVQDPTFPLYQMADLAGKAEKKAKDNQDKEGRKDSLAPFYPSWIFEDGRQEPTHALKWEEAEQLFSLAQDIILGVGGRIEGNGKGKVLAMDVPRAFLHALFDVVEARRKNCQFPLPKLAWALTQKGSREHQDLDQLKQQLWDLKTLSYLHPALVWVELLARREQREP